jgi:DNA-binding MarR family transcriptional regulator
MNEKMASPGPRYGALLQLLRAAETIWNGSRLFFARWDLSPSQFNILNLLKDLPDGLSQVDLSRQLIMHRSNVTGLVDRLEERGLVQRLETPGDRRSYQVVLTAAGNLLIRKILPHYYFAAEAVWGSISVKQVNRLMADLDEIIANAEGISQRNVQQN